MCVCKDALMHMKKHHLYIILQVKQIVMVSFQGDCDYVFVYLINSYLPEANISEQTVRRSQVFRGW